MPRDRSPDRIFVPSGSRTDEGFVEKLFAQERRVFTAHSGHETTSLRGRLPLVRRRPPARSSGSRWARLELTRLRDVTNDELLGQRRTGHEAVWLRARAPGGAAVWVQRVEHADTGHVEVVGVPGSAVDSKPLMTHACRPRHITRPTGRSVARIASAAVAASSSVGMERAHRARCRGRSGRRSSPLGWRRRTG